MYIGDSITFGYGLSGTPPPEQTVPLLTASNPAYEFVALNDGSNGASTATWAELHGGSLLADAIILITQQGITRVSIMLGTNDANIDNRNATDYQSNIQFIVDTLASNGVTKIVLNQPPYLKTENIVGANTVLTSYNAAITNLVAANPGLVYIGDMTAFSVFQSHSSTYYQLDGVHPNDTGATALANLWAAVYPV